ncbi:nitroreductase family protein [Herpetosiphon giganteus]|uniref:nitroreductase family protein n=1 Tax=Herpetosiphon giganteus TaxID=2029754 RepID=UPI00195D78B2|nr:nitroreductase family protein [Herpetosiphon giganteus]MBM7845262.1 SagB-type dehydrogenase family enzyme [Herpetosiphon giganteus]
MTQAFDLHSHLQSDPQVQMPTRPRISDEIARVWYNEQLLLLLGGPHDVVLRGKAVRNLLPQLLPLLNGLNSRETIGERLAQFKPATIDDTLQLLHVQGVLEEGPLPGNTLDPQVARAFSQQLAFYSRFVDQTRICRNRYEVLQRLQSTPLLLLGGERLVAPLLHQLAQAGLGRATWLANVVPTTTYALPHLELELQVPAADGLLEAVDHWLAQHNDGLICLLTSTAQTELTQALNQRAIQAQSRFTRLWLHPQHIELGPTTFAHEAGCYACAEAVESNTPDLSEPNAPLSLNEQLALSQASLVIGNLISGLSPIITGGVRYLLDPVSLEFVAQSVHRLVHCPVCGQPNLDAPRDLLVGAGHFENLPLWYHANTDERSYAIFPKAHQQHYAPKNALAIVSGAKGYTNVQRHALSQLQGQWQPDAVVDIGVQLPVQASIAPLAWLLEQAFVRKPSSQTIGAGQRFVPSGGNMASQTVYLLNHKLNGLATGIYHLNQHEATLEAIRPSFSWDEVAKVFPADPLDAQTLGLLVLTAAIGRVEAKYGAKSYRLALYDCGAAAQAIELLAGAAGWQVEQISLFYDQELRDVLQVYSPSETPLLVLRLVAPNAEVLQ